MKWHKNRPIGPKIYLSTSFIARHSKINPIFSLKHTIWQPWFREIQRNENGSYLFARVDEKNKF
jgi:hypothetical protein